MLYIVKRKQIILKFVLILLSVIIIFSLAFHLGQLYAPDLNCDSHNEHEYSSSPPVYPGPLEAASINWDDIEILSHEPRVYLFHNFLTSEQCQYLIQLGKDSMGVSMVVAYDGSAITHPGRTSTEFSFYQQHHLDDPVVRYAAEKIAYWTNTKLSQGEAFHLLHYEIGQEFRPHYDAFSIPQLLNFSGGGGQRIASVIVYLSPPEAGGETTFPKSAAGLAVKPVAGEALLFWDLAPDFSCDSLSLHQSLPVITGDKWCMTKWIRQYEH